MFAAGVILFIMVYGSPPFIKASDNDPHYEIMQNEKDEYKKFLTTLGDADESFQDFIIAMLHKNPEKRLTIRQIKKHPWFN